MLFLGILFILIGIVITLFVYSDYGIKRAIITLLVALAISVPLIIIGAKSNSFKRFMKDTESNYSGGINRTIIITAEDGRIIYEYEGTVDIEVNAADRKLKFEDENGKRQIIIYGMQDTVQIIEK